MASKEEYVARATATIMRLLDEQHALAGLEVSARISEGSFAGSKDNIDPHHVTTALSDLVRAGRIIRDYSTTRGGGSIATIKPAEQRRRTTKIEQAAARKRLLAARYNSWAVPNSRYPRGLLGPAGETAARAALERAGQMQPATPGFAETSELLGIRLDGPVDCAGYLVPLSSSGRPQPVVTVLVEVKNIRSWIYPSTIELYQVLDKASVLQRAQPDEQVLPILICRKAHKTAFWMATQLGFMIIDAGIQYVGTSVAEPELLEVRNELYLNDLHLGLGPARRVQDRFTSVVPENAARLAGRWKATCEEPRRVELLHDLRYMEDNAMREQLLRELRRSGSWRGGW